jgi:hypothetical protein
MTRSLATLALEAVQGTFALCIVIALFPLLLVCFAGAVVAFACGVNLDMKTLRWLRAAVAFPWAMLAHISNPE